MRINTVEIQSQLARSGKRIGDLAAASGISHQNLSQILKRGTCQTVTIGKIAKGLDVDPSKIIIAEVRQ